MLRKVIALYLVIQLIFQGSLLFEVVSLLVRVVEVKGAWAGPICVQPEGAVKPAEFDPNAGYCVTPVLSESGQCPGFYVFKPELGACIANPICSGVEYWDVNTKQCVSVGVGGGGSGDGFGLDPNKSYCAVDLNGDGEIGQNEIRECVRTQEGGYLCPLQMAKCNVNYICPSGSSYYYSTGKCEANVSIICPSGSSYYYSTGKCEANASIICPSGSSYNYSTGKCEANMNFYSPVVSLISASPACGSSWFSSSTQFYIGNDAGWGWGTTSTVSFRITGVGSISVGSLFKIYGDYSCPPHSYWGYACYDDDHWVCVSSSVNTSCCFYGGDYDPLHWAGCVLNIPPVVDQTITFQITSGGGHKTEIRCKVVRFDFSLSSVGSCPSGMSYNSNTQKCESTPQYSCPSGMSFNSYTWKCEATPQYSCPWGMSFNSYTWKCEATANIQYVCPLDNSVNKCQTYNGEKYCSLTNCINPSQVQDDEPDTIPFGYEDDGARDDEGNCLGELFIFNGKGMRCRLSGIQTGFQNCCDKNRGILQDNFGGMSALDIKHLVEGLYGLYQVGRIAKYAYDLGQKALVLKQGPGFVFLEKNVVWGGEVARFAVGTPEASALSAASFVAENGAGSAAATSAALQTYLNPQINPHVALAITKLAISQVIDDPVLASLANLGATLVFAYYFPILMNPLTIALAVVEVFLALFSGSCDQQDIMTATLQKSGYCHYVGTKCLKKWPLAGCVQKAKVYCCFNSKLARIIHEQGRPQLDTFVSSGMWGSKDNPYCRGFTPDEFQALDFGKIDLSEYYGDILKNINQNIEGTINRTIQPTLDTLQKYGN